MVSFLLWAVFLSPKFHFCGSPSSPDSDVAGASTEPWCFCSFLSICVSELVTMLQEKKIAILILSEGIQI